MSLHGLGRDTRIRTFGALLGDFVVAGGVSRQGHFIRDDDVALGAFDPVGVFPVPDVVHLSRVLGQVQHGVGEELTIRAD